MLIRRLLLENWRNFQRVDVPIAPRAFLGGPNASGKSNLLDAIRFLRDLAAVGGGLQDAVARRGGASSIRSLAARRYSDVRILVEVDDNNGDPWEYSVTFNQDRQRRPQVKSETVRRGARTILDRPSKEDEADPARLTQTFLEQVNVNRDFRDLVTFFSSIRYLHVIPHLIREPDRWRSTENDPFGSDLLEVIATTNERTKLSRLRRIQEALRVAVPQLKELELHRDEKGRPHLRGKYEHWRPQGAWQSEQEFSDGTLRLLGLLWAVLEGSGPLLLEEPELSLHSDVIRYLPQLLARVQQRSGRQLILSTHSRDLLLDRGIGLNEVLVLDPSSEGTSVQPASTFSEIVDLLDGGIPVADAVIPRTRPRHPEQLSFFAD